MNTAVKELFRRETADLVQFDDFNKIFYVIEQLIELDLEVSTLKGLSERLVPAFNKIAAEKMDRTDLVTTLPTVFGLFEPFVKKVLYIVDKSKFDALAADKRNSLQFYLNALGFVPKRKDPGANKVIHEAYELRNSESHVCESWSNKELYNKLAYVLAAYMVVVDKQLVALETMGQKTPEPFLIDFESCENGIVVDPIRNGYQYFFRIADYNCNFRAVEIDEEGERKLILPIGTADADIPSGDAVHQVENTERVQYTVVDDRVVRKTYRRRLYSRDSREKSYTLYDAVVYKYNEKGWILSITEYRDDSKVEGVFKSSELRVDYKSSGAVELIIDHYRVENTSEDRKTRLFNPRFEVVHKGTKVVQYNKYGLLEGILQDGIILSKCEYDDNNCLTRICGRNGQVTEVVAVGEELFFKTKDVLGDKDVIQRSMVYVDGKLQKIKKYSPDPDKDGSNVVDEWIFEY